MTLKIAFWSIFFLDKRISLFTIRRCFDFLEEGPFFVDVLPRQKEFFILFEEGGPVGDEPAKKKKVAFWSTFFHDKEEFFISLEEGRLLVDLLPR